MRKREIAVLAALALLFALFINQLDKHHAFGESYYSGVGQ